MLDLTRPRHTPPFMGPLRVKMARRVTCENALEFSHRLDPKHAFNAVLLDSLFRSLLRGPRALRVEKIAKNFALLDRLQIFAEFSHGCAGRPASGAIHSY
jgi:hypothetical protein